jgi:hypothetical protein
MPFDTGLDSEIINNSNFNDSLKYLHLGNQKNRLTSNKAIHWKRCILSYINPLNTIEIENIIFKESLFFESNQFHKLIIFACTLNNGFSLADNTIDTVVFVNCQFDSSASITANGIKLMEIDWSNINYFGFALGSFQEGIFSEHSHFNGSFNNTGIGKKLFFKECTINNLVFRRMQLPDSIAFINSKIDNEINLLDFDAPGKGKYYSICLYGTNYDKVNFSYNNFRLFFPDSVKTEMKKSIYESLLGHFKSIGFNESYKQLDIEYKSFNYLQYIKFGKELNWVQKNWWNYGYDKSRVLIWTAILLALFGFFNLFWFKHLLNAYVLENIRQKYLNRKGNKIIRKFQYIALCFIYTSIIFVGLKLEIDKFNFIKIRTVIYIFFIYAIGLMCVGFLANFIFTK